jgi:hypothetical protein
MFAVIALVGLAVGWIFFRNSTNKIMLSIALATVTGGAFRLYEIISTGEQITPLLLAFVVLGAIWLLAWLSNRSIARKPTATLAPKSRSGPPRVG